MWLSSAWALTQGYLDRSRWFQHRRWTRTYDDVCGNPRCIRPSPRRLRRWRGFIEDSRCSACRQYLDLHDGRERPCTFHRRDGHHYTRADHDRWLEGGGNADVSGNCKPHEPRDPVGTKWSSHTIPRSRDAMRAISISSRSTKTDFIIYTAISPRPAGACRVAQNPKQRRRLRELQVQPSRQREEVWLEWLL